jgi:hypothetical protein
MGSLTKCRTKGIWIFAFGGIRVDIKIYIDFVYVKTPPVELFNSDRFS